MKKILSMMLIICFSLFCFNTTQGQDLSTRPNNGYESHNTVIKFNHDDFKVLGLNVDEILSVLAGDTNTFKIVFTPATGRIIYDINSMVDTIYLDYQNLISNTNTGVIKKYFSFLSVLGNDKDLDPNYFIVNIIDLKIDASNFPNKKNNFVESNIKSCGSFIFSGKFSILTF